MCLGKSFEDCEECVMYKQHINNAIHEAQKQLSLLDVTIGYGEIEDLAVVNAIIEKIENELDVSITGVI